jgi:ketosteroid isomerase-like protein
MSEIEDTVRRYYRTVDTLGPEETVALFADDATYRRPGYDVMRGHAALLKFYGGERVIASGRHVVDEIVVDGTHAAVRGSFRGLLRDGTEVEVEFADFLHYDAERIAERTTYFYRPAV